MNKKTVFVSGNFNVLHPGHLRLLRFAKESGDHLIIGLQSDESAGKDVYVNYKHRMEGLLTNIWVDKVFKMDGPPSELILKLRPDIIVKGREFQFKKNTEDEVIKSYGGKLIFSSGDSTFSSIDLLKNEMSINNSNIFLPENFLLRHSIDKKDIINLINNFKNKRVCVIGDLIVDEYITCEALGMSQEEPTLVVTPIDTAKFIGGAGIVAAHAAGLGSKVDYLSLRGNDQTGELAEKLLKNAGVDSFFIINESHTTTLKQRYRSQGKSLLRVNNLRKTFLTLEQQKTILEKFNTIIDKVDLLVFSDFNYGCLPQGLVKKMICLAKKYKIVITADSQCSSQLGDISRFFDTDLITPTENEARISMNNYEDGLVVLSDKIRLKTNSKNVLLKLGEEGLLIHGKNNKKWSTDRIIALNSSQKDVSGAGDSLLMAASLALASGANIWQASLLGTMGAAIQVGRVGNIPLSSKEIIEEFR